MRSLVSRGVALAVVLSICACSNKEQSEHKGTAFMPTVQKEPATAKPEEIKDDKGRTPLELAIAGRHAAAANHLRQDAFHSSAQD